MRKNVRILASVLPFFIGLFISNLLYAQTINTFAGTGSNSPFNDNVAALSANINSPRDLIIDAAGNIIFCDIGNFRVRKINTSGIISTIAGNGTNTSTGDGGLATDATLLSPIGVTLDGVGNLYICETNKIRKVNTSGIISTIAGTGSSGFNGDGGLAVNALLNNVRGIVVDSVGVVYFTDGLNNRVRKIDLNGIISTYAGGGSVFVDNVTATSSLLSNPVGIAIYGSDIYVTENSGQRVRKIDNAGIITTYAGTGSTSFNNDNIPATTANLSNPARISFDQAGNLYIGCQGYVRIRKVDKLTGLITTVAGTGVSGFTGDGGLATLANIGQPAGMASDANGNFYYSDVNANRIRKICLGSASASTPTLSASSTSICAGTVVTLSIASGNLNDAASWEWYNGSCGGTAIGTGTSITVSPTVATTYYARGTGGCVAAGNCDSIHISLVAPPVIHLGAPDDSVFCPGVIMPLRAFIDTVQMPMNNSGQAGGTPISCHCPPGYVAVGFNGRTGSWLDKIQLACRKLNTNGTLDTAVVYTNTMGGNGGSPNGPYLLSGDTVLVGADLYKNNNYLTWIKGYGQPISHLMANGNNGSSPVAMATMGAGTPSTFFNQQFAAAGQVIVGLKGWVNGFVPGLSLITMPISRVAGNSYVWSNSSTDSVINVSTPGTYSVTVTGNGGCVATASIQMTQRVTAAFSSCPANMVENMDNGCDKVVTYSPVVVGTTPITQSFVLSGATTLSGSGTGSGSTFNRGVTNVKLYISNICGIDSCQFTVTVTDTIKPVISCNTNLVQNQDAGTCGAVVNYSDPTTTDNCMNDVNNTLEQVLSRFNTNATTITATVPNKYTFNFDASGGVNGVSISDGGNDMYDGGNTISTNLASNINYSDNAILNSTSFGTKGRYVTRYSSGMFMLAADLVNVNTFFINGNLGADGSGSMSAHQFNLLSHGINYKVFTKRVYGTNDPSVNHVFIIPDNPSVTRTLSTNTNDDLDQLNNLNATSRIYYLLYAGTSGFNIDSTTTAGIAQAFLDNATGPYISSITINQISGLASGSVFPVGITNNVFVASDESGNTDTCSFTVTVLDNTNPTISCPLNIVQSNDAGSCSAIVNYTAPVGTDNCPGATTVLASGLPSGSVFPSGITTNKFIVTDASGNKDSCSFTVTVNDNEIPVLTNPGNQSLNVIANTCTATYTIADPITDNCAGSSWRYILTGATVASGVYLADGVDALNVTFNKGETTVTLEGLDAANLSAVPQVFTVTVTDNQAPDITCAAPVTLIASPGLCAATTVLTAPAISDNCSTTGNALNFDGTSDRVQLNTGTTLTGPFTIEAWVKPTIKSTFSTILGNKIGGAGSSGFVFAINNFQQSDAKLVLETKSKSVSSSSGVITWGAWQHVSVTYDGSIVRMYLNATQIPLTDSSAINLVSSGNPLVIGDFYQFVLGGKFLGTMDELRIWNVARTQAEIAGNMNNELNAQPGLLAAYHFNQGIAGDNNAGITTLLDASGNANTGTLSTFTLNGPTSNWVGGLINGLPTLTNNAPSSFPVGNTNVVWTATDASSNTATCTQLVTVLDQQLPIISCPGVVAVSNDAGQCSAVVNYTTPIGTDNCTGAITTQTEGLASGSAFPVGVTTNKFIVTDSSGNKDSCSFTITVNDTELPTISCPLPVSVSNDNNMCSAIVNYSTPVGADNCAGATTVQTEGLASGSTFPIGVTTNKFIVTDANGNKDSCSFTVTVTDNQLPVINCAANILATSGYTPIAFYPLNTNLADMSGNFGNMILNGNPTAPASPGIGNPLCLNGIYLANTNGQNAITPNIASLNATNFKLNVDFKLNGYPGINGFPVIMGGDGFRWIGVYVNASGKAGVKYNNSIKVFSNTTLNLNQWYTATITYVNNTITLLIDNTVVLVQNVGPLVTGNNYKFLTSDFSVGTALNGCVRNLQISNGTATCGSIVYYTPPVGTDNCPGATTAQTEGLASGSVFPLGVTTNKFVVTDANGNKDSCSFTVTVIDTLAPSLSCPFNITIQNDAGQCYGTIVLPSTLVLQYNPTGAQATNVPVNATFSGNGYSGTPLSQVGLLLAGNTNVWPVGTISSSPTISLGQYLTFTINVPSGTDLARIQYSKRSYFGSSATSASVRSSLDGYASDISMISVNPVGGQELVFDVSSMPFVSGPVTFRIYFWGAPVNFSDWVDLVSTASGGNGLRVYANTLSTASDICNYTLSYSNFSPNYQYPIGTTIIQSTATDASNNSTSCSFSVTVISPEIDLKGNNASIVDGDVTPDLADHTDFGDVTVGQTFTRTFTIRNNGTANLNLASGAITITGTNPSAFSLGSVTLPLTLAPGDSLNFDVTFNASTVGIKNATINIANNDCDEAAYDFAIKGNGDCLPVTISCPGNQTATTAQGVCNAVVSYTSSSTGIPSPTLTYKFTGATTGTGSGHGSGSIFNIGVTHVTLYATNSCSLDSCAFDVTVSSGTTGSSSHTTCDSYHWSNGTTYTNTGIYTWTFTNANGCDSVHTLNLTIHYSNHLSSTVSNFGCYTWPVNNQTYTVSGTYIASFLNQYGCDSIHTLSLSITPGVKLAAKAILDGPFDATSGLMSDSLRVNHLIPNTEPYTASPYLKPAIGGPSGETVSNAMLNVTGNDAIVDWVYLELREALNPSNIVASKRALLQRDGDIVSHVDATSPVLFETVYNGNYFVTVKHRNHLGIMSANALNLQGCSTTSIDFTNSNPVYTMSSISTTARKQVGSVYTMWSADLNTNKNVKYNGLSNDKDRILIAVGVGNPNNSVNNVYRMEDANMDGKIRYNNTDNDRMIIISNVGVNSPNNILNQHTPN